MINRIYKCACGKTGEEHFYKNSGGKCKKCRIEFQKKYYELNKLNEIKRANNWVRNNQIKVKLLGAKKRADKKGWDFELNEELIKQKLIEQNNKCYYSGIEFTKKDGWDTFSIDRTDSNKGYTIENTKLVLSDVNFMKQELSENQFFELIEKIYKNKVREKLAF